MMARNRFPGGRKPPGGPDRPPGDHPEPPRDGPPPFEDEDFQNEEPQPPRRPGRGGGPGWMFDDSDLW